MVAGEVSHDRVTRFLSERDDTSRDRWLQVKSTVREIAQPEAVPIFDEGRAWLAEGLRARRPAGWSSLDQQRWPHRSVESRLS